MGVISWMGVRLIHEHDLTIQRVSDNRDRVMMLEQATQFHREQLIELKSVNRGILEQLEKLRIELRSKP